MQISLQHTLTSLPLLWPRSLRLEKALIPKPYCLILLPFFQNFDAIQNDQKVLKFENLLQLIASLYLPIIHL